MTADFSSENMQARRQWNIFKVLKEKTAYPEFYTQDKNPSGMKTK